MEQIVGWTECSGEWSGHCDGEMLTAYHHKTSQFLYVAEDLYREGNRVGASKGEGHIKEDTKDVCGKERRVWLRLGTNGMVCGNKLCGFVKFASRGGAVV
jgi:hypothetical protein